LTGAGWFFTTTWLEPWKQSAKDTLKRWMSSAKTAKDLDRLAEIEQPELRYFPIWRFRIVDDKGEQVHAVPAVAETLPFLREVAIPPGELRFSANVTFCPSWCSLRFRTRRR
jgi:hypothetical protein